MTIAEQLRHYEGLLGSVITPYEGDLMVQAADHIEKLEAALREITQRPAYAMDIAREALKKDA